jgi:hypothetical protein
MTHPEYPAWICGDCGDQIGRRNPVNATWSMGECGWCASVDVPVTEPRDYGWPPMPGVAVTRCKAAE